MPRGGIRKPLNPVVMEELDCIGYLSVERPHKFKRPKGSHQRQCDRCWQGSAYVRQLPVLQPEEVIRTTCQL